MGKSTAARLLFEAGVPVADSDQLARELVEPGQPALKEIQEAFGAEFLDERGGLRRQELGRRIFRDAADRARLEGILHPRIRAEWRGRMLRWGEAGYLVAAVDIPLLFETRAESEVDIVVCVACSASTQRQRLLLRGWSPEEIDRRLASQWPIARKLAHSHFVLWNESSVEILRAQWARVFAAEKLEFRA